VIANSLGHACSLGKVSSSSVTCNSEDARRVPRQTHLQPRALIRGDGVKGDERKRPAFCVFGSTFSSIDVALRKGLMRVFEDLLSVAVLDQVATEEDHRGVRNPSCLPQIVGYDDRRWPSRMWRSLPQMVVESTRTTASLSSFTLGSATTSQLLSFGP